MAQRLPGDAFAFYAGLGPTRSYQAVAAKFGVSKRSVTRRAAEENWPQRILELEQKARQGAEQKVQESLEEMNVRHLKILRAIQTKALQALQQFSIASAMEAVRSLELSIRQERVARGEPGGGDDVNVEVVIRREHERWLKLVGADVDAS